LVYPPLLKAFFFILACDGEPITLGLLVGHTLMTYARFQSRMEIFDRIEEA